jgi:hypothetical protein
MLFLDQPVIVEPTPAKTYPIVWIYNLTIRAHDPTGEGSLTLELLPMSEDRELYFPSAVQLSTDELYRAIEEVPELAQAFGAILAAVKPFQNWIMQQQQSTPEENENVEN